MSDTGNETILLTLGRTLVENSESGSASAAFNPILFWTINALWIGILLITCVWCWRFNGAQWMVTSFSTTNSDLAYRMRLYQRRQAELERNKVSPEKQRKTLSEYFRSHKVHMVVREGDVTGERIPQHEHIITDPNSTNPANVEPRSIEPSTVELDPIESIVTEPINPVLPNDTEAGTLTNESAKSVVLDVMDQQTLPTDIETGILVDRLEFSVRDRLECSVRDPLDGSMIDLLDESIRSKTEGYLALTNSKSVPNCCAVCLGSYEVGDDVVWSNNCNHAFHEDCVTDWLIKMQSNHPCPCCRTPFVDIEAVKEDPSTSDASRSRTRPITWEAGDTMNVGVIRFR